MDGQDVVFERLCDNRHAERAREPTHSPWLLAYLHQRVCRRGGCSRRWDKGGWVGEREKTIRRLFRKISKVKQDEMETKQ